VGAREGVSPRVVFDTTTVVSALIVPQRSLAWLRQHWRDHGCVPLISRATATELTRVLSYPKFRLSRSDQQELLADYLPYCEVVEATGKCAETCRDPNDQPFLDLAQSGKAEVLVSGDQELLTLSGRTSFRVESPVLYWQKVIYGRSNSAGR
jgi:putative PIN family toxin of toxin-antitoxin system